MTPQWHPSEPVIASVTNQGNIFIWHCPTTERWGAFAGGFEEVDENVEYEEREDEFDIVSTLHFFCFRSSDVDGMAACRRTKQRSRVGSSWKKKRLWTLRGRMKTWPRRLLWTLLDKTVTQMRTHFGRWKNRTTMKRAGG